MINPFIKLTGFRDKQEIFISADKIFVYNKHFHENYTEVEIDRLTIDVSETPEEIFAMIQKYYEEKMRMDFIQSVLTGICANITVNDMTTDHRSLCIDAVQIGNAMMEVLKND